MPKPGYHAVWASEPTQLVHCYTRLNGKGKYFEKCVPRAKYPKPSTASPGCLPLCAPGGRLTAERQGWLPLRQHQPPTAPPEEEFPSCKAHVTKGREFCKTGHERLVAQPWLHCLLMLALLVKRLFFKYTEEIKSST